MADNLTSLPIRTKTHGDLIATIDQTTPGTTNGVVITTALPSGTNLLGKVGIDQTNAGVTNGVQIVAAIPTGSNVIGAVTQSGTWAVGLNSGSNIVGRFGIDQTNAGVTNGVQLVGPGTATGTPIFNQTLGIYNTSAPTLTTGNTSVLQLDVNGNLKVVVGGGTGSTIGNVGLNSGSNLVGKFGIDQTSPGVTNAIQLTGPGTSSGNPVYVNTGAGTTGTVKNSGQVKSGTDIAPGSNATLASVAITAAKVASLEHVVMSSAGPMKFDIQSVSNSGTATTVYTFFTTSANLNTQFDAMPGGEFTLVAADGTNAKFQVVATNQDNSNANTAYATFVWIEN